MFPAPSLSRLVYRVACDAPWLAVGDAALAVDPISGSGVVRALRMAEAAADTSPWPCWPGLPGTGLRAYEAALDEDCTEYLTERAGQYGAVRRFDTPFWARRGTVAASRPDPTPRRSRRGSGCGPGRRPASSLGHQHPAGARCRSQRPPVRFPDLLDERSGARADGSFGVVGRGWVGEPRS